MGIPRVARVAEVARVAGIAVVARVARVVGITQIPLVSQASCPQGTRAFGTCLHGQLLFFMSLLRSKLLTALKKG